MKTTKVPQAISLLLILVIAVSCRSSRSTSSRQYPGNTPTETPTKIPTETPMKTYPVVYADRGNLPPGQAKKVYGSQSAKAYAPGQQKKYANRHPLVIVYTPAMVVNQYSNGRYYYRNTAGYMYWKGYDGRYYIDEKHLKGMDYEVSDYDDWKFKGQNNNVAKESKGENQEEKVKDYQKAKDVEHLSKVREQKAKDQNQKAKGNDPKAKELAEQKAKDNDQKGKDQTDQKVKDDNPPKGKAKSNGKA
ncbi:MAG TPA: hypothetical protein VFH08_19965 [Chitinophagaceae bacterium]|nr:hypothetical protein [Chitinophagaceae bacterium]